MFPTIWLFGCISITIAEFHNKLKLEIQASYLYNPGSSILYPQFEDLSLFDINLCLYQPTCYLRGHITRVILGGFGEKIALKNNPLPKSNMKKTTY